jgi:hypothetical protein
MAEQNKCGLQAIVKEDIDGCKLFDRTRKGHSGQRHTDPPSNRAPLSSWDDNVIELDIYRYKDVDRTSILKDGYIYGYAIPSRHLNFRRAVGASC